MPAVMFTVREIVDPSDPDFFRLYADVWKSCFPLDLLPFKAFRGKIREREFKEGVYHIFVVKNRANAVVAGISFYFFFESRKNGFAFGADEYIGVAPDYRKMGIGRRLAVLRSRILQRDARAEGKKRVEFIMGEYYDQGRISPELVRKDGFDPVARKTFWKKTGMKALDFDYENPGIFDHRKIERVYTVGIKITDARYREKVPAAFVAAMLSAYYRNFYGINRNHAVMRRLRALWKSRESVRVVDLV
jgi:GNAT superfamily N-acetyltransferase